MTLNVWSSCLYFQSAWVTGGAITSSLHRPRAVSTLGKHCTTELHYQLTLLTFNLGKASLLVSVHGIIHRKEVTYSPYSFFLAFFQFFLFFLLDRVSLYRPGWPGTQFIAQTGPTNLIFLSLSPKNWGYKCAPPRLTEKLPFSQEK